MPATARPITVVIAAGLLAGLLSACAGGPAIAQPTAIPESGTNSGSESESTSWHRRSDAYARLVALREAEQPSESLLPAPSLRGLDTDALTPLDPDDPNAGLATRPLAEVLAELSQPPDDSPETAPAPPPSEFALIRAQQLYASGLSKLLDRDPANAARDFGAATQLDPTTPAPWLKLAEAQSVMGQAGAAMLSRRKAADLGANDPLTLGVLGIQSSRTGQHELAAGYLARCLESQPERADPLLRQVALVRLADPLAQLGYLQASIDALRQGLDLPTQLRAPTRFAEEGSDIARRASDLWVRIGDTACRLGDDSLAAEAYTNAAGLPSVDPGAIAARRAFVLLRRGRTASVALLTLDGIADRDGRADTRDLALLAVVRDDAEVGPLAARAIADLRGSITGRTATTNTLLTLAEAAACPTDTALTLLSQRAAEAPGDARALDALFSRCDNASAIETTALRLTDQSPDQASTIARSLSPWHPEPGPLARRLPDTPSGRLLSAGLLLELERPAEVLALPAGQSGAAAELRAIAAAYAGAWDQFDAMLPTLTGPSAARALRAAQRYEAALGAIGPALQDPHAPIPTLLLGAEMALNSADPHQAAALLDRALAIDEFDERVYEGLINVRRATGDTRGAADAIRDLRERVPSSHLLRWVNAQEEARRGLIDQAERSARELAEDASAGTGALGLLLRIWAQRNSAGDTDSLQTALAWITPLCETPPVTGELLAANGTLLKVLGQSEEAELVLRRATASRPNPAVSRALENLLLATDRADEAQLVAAERFEAMGHGIDACLERAEHMARRSRWPEAVDAALLAMPAPARIKPEQEQRMLQLVAMLAGHVAGQPTPEEDDAALRLLNAAEARGLPLDWQFSYSRWALLARSADATPDEIAGAADTLLLRIPSDEVAARIIGDMAARLGVATDTLDLARGQIAYQLAGTLYANGRADAALPVYRIALRYNPDHAWAANDLGYFLTERHEQLDEAERLLAHAYTLEPGQYNIADSLGWLRYKLGQLQNETRPDGEVREGAVSLLIAASGLPGGAQSATVHAHLGDALWRTGEKERAEAEWLRAQQLLVGELAALQDGGSSPQRDDLTAEAAGVAARLDAVRSGASPPVAPLFGEGDGPG